jgi:two-component system sensor histidine kinase CreC
MRLGYAIFLGYFLIALLAGYFVLNVFVEEIKPSARQSMEDSLVDAANLLAEIAVDDLKNNQLSSGAFARQIAAYNNRNIKASIWGVSRERSGFRIYITDARGFVLYDSINQAVGKDFSQWNDVYLTLKGQYGVRSSPDSEQSTSTTMHVAAAIKDDGKIIGSLTIAKSNLSVEPFIARTKSKIINAGYWLLAASLLIGLLISYWLSISVRKLVTYANAVAHGEQASLPSLSLLEIKLLGNSLHSMRERLEGKRYVEEYVMTLTHEMKSPLTAIQASAELLQEPMPEVQRQKFLESIFQQSKRLHKLIEKMLWQASVEYRQTLESVERINLVDILSHVAETKGSTLQLKNLNLRMKAPTEALIDGDRFLLEQAFSNIVENAVEFSPEGTEIEIDLTRDEANKFWLLLLRDHGPGIPNFAQDIVFQRYYSLARPGGGAKSTGLGLSFVTQVMRLHKGRADISNHPEGGAEVKLSLPIA